MLEDISNPFFAKLARILEDLAFQKQYKVFFCSTENKDERAIDLIKTFRERRVDGYMIAPTPGIESHIENFLEEEIPIILFDRYFPNLKTNYVGIDNEDSVYQAVQHFFTKGYQNVALITIDSPQSQMLNRFSGYRKAITENGKESFVLKIPFSENIKKNAETHICAFLETYPEIDAILFTTNYLSIAGLKVIKGKDYEFKNELGIITFDDNDLFQIHRPTISVIHQPLQEIAEAMMNLMLEELSQKTVNRHKTVRKILKTQFIERESSVKK